MDLTNVDSGSFVTDLQEQVKRLESRLIHLEGNTKDQFRDRPGIPEADETSSGLHYEDTDHDLHLTYKPEVRKCNFANFKNRFGREDACYAIDVLVSGDSLHQEYLEERRLRDRLSEHSGIDLRAAKRNAQTLVRENERNTSALRSNQSHRTWIQRIRVQAPMLLDFLARVQNESWSSQPRTYSSPFTTLIYYQPEAKRALAELEEKWASQSEGCNTPLPIDPSACHDESRESAHESFSETTEATLKILRTYVRLIDEEIIPESLRFDNLDHSSNAGVRFSELCYLFTPGDFLYRPSESEKLGEPGLSRDANTAERVWRVSMVTDASRSFHMPTSEYERHALLDSDDDDERYFKIDAYHIDYNGDEFCVVPETFRVAPYDGLKLISNLDFFPIRFKKDYEVYLEESKRLGEQVVQYINTKHAFYDDWTVLRNPKGSFVTDADGSMVKHREYINSEVMVDFQEAFQNCPSWQPARTVLRPEFINKTQTYDEFPIRWQSGRDRARILRETQEIRPYRTGVCFLKRNEFIRNDPFLKAVADNDQRGLRTTQECLHREEKVLIHGRVFAYVFSERKFAQLHVSKLKPATRNLDALEALKIPPDTKKIIQGSVRGHFLQKEAEARRPEKALSQDVIQGKGTGLFILLHGVPGVGKTMTAEAVAQANGKPLFKITCGDIGLTPEQVETSLRGIFRLASTWDCILLMDEVDTFFAQRSKGDAAIIKNALVTVFLRVLDYYSGILFLTTNRLGSLDEAFKSRIPLKLYYPPLSKDQTLEIWRFNIRRLSQMNERSADRWSLDVHDNDILAFAETQYDEAKKPGRGRWNGRQIRNAFQVARNLAHYDALARSENTAELVNGTLPPAILTVEYFHMMHTITEEFDRYMLDIYSGQDDADLALELEHRADHFASDRWARTTRGHDSVNDPLQTRGIVKTSFDVEYSRDQNTTERRSSMRGSRPSLASVYQGRGPDSLAPPVNATYDEVGPATRNSPSQRQRPYDAPARDTYGSPQETEHTAQHNPFAPSRTTGGFGSSAARATAPTGMGHASGRENRQYSLHESDQYLSDRNEYGKRERHF